MMSSRLAFADDEPLHIMDHEQAVTCHGDDSGQRWRVQCDRQTMRCLYAPDGVLDDTGKATRPLQRARYCPMQAEPFDPSLWQRDGYTMVRGLPDAPYGWTRDARGRVMQVNFDLARRMYLGGGYAPTTLATEEFTNTGRAAIDVGMLIMEQTVGRTRHRLHLVQGQLFLAPFSADMVLLHYDFSHRYEDPILRITTFFGQPRRRDLGLNVGVWVEGGGIEVRSADDVQERLWKLATLHGTLDLWQSRDMYSFVRLRGGLGLESATVSTDERRAAITPGGALQADITFDRAGFHHMGVELEYENPLYSTVDPRVGDSARRVNATVEYEMIFLAINDQPLSLHLDVGAEKRNDSPLITSRWTAKANAGLRFSLWAPARTH